MRNIFEIKPQGCYSIKDLAELFEVKESAIYPFVRQIKSNKAPRGTRVMGSSLIEYFQANPESHLLGAETLRLLEMEGDEYEST